MNLINLLNKNKYNKIAVDIKKYLKVYQINRCYDYKIAFLKRKRQIATNSFLK